MKVGKVTKKAILLSSAMLAGVIIIIPFAKNAGTSRYIALGGFTIGTVAFLRLIALAPEIWNEISAPITLTKAQHKISKVIHAVSFVLFLASTAFLLFEIDNIDNTIGGLKMLGMAFLAGLLVGIILTVATSFQYSHLKRDKERRVDILAGIPLAFALFAAALASYWNHSEADEMIVDRSFHVQSKGSSSNSSQLYLYIKTANGQERLTVPKEVWQNVDANDSINLRTKNGGLGFPIVLFE